MPREGEVPRRTSNGSADLLRGRIPPQVAHPPPPPTPKQAPDPPSPRGKAGRRNTMAQEPKSPAAPSETHALAAPRANLGLKSPQASRNPPAQRLNPTPQHHTPMRFRSGLTRHNAMHSRAEMHPVREAHFAAQDALNPPTPAPKPAPQAHAHAVLATPPKQPCLAGARAKRGWARQGEWSRLPPPTADPPCLCGG